MKLKEKEFKIYENERPKVLLLGNGLYRAYGGMPWDKLLDEIKDDTLFPLKSKQYHMPMPLKAEMLTNNNLASRMRDIVKDTHSEKDVSWDNFTSTTPELREMVRSIVSKGFDYVLTTNYSYEVEASLLNSEKVTEYRIRRLMNFYEIENAQTQFLTNTFNMIGNIPVWHIHGEARKPNSMVIGNYFYGKVLKRCIERLDGSSNGSGSESQKDKKDDRSGIGKSFQKNIREERAQKIGSWIDAFVLGDVYIIGLGLDFSEIDLWWLLEYKLNNEDIAGETILFEPLHEKKEPSPANNDDGPVATESECRHLLLDSVYGVQIENLDYVIKDNESEEYRGFYRKVVDAL